MIPKVIHRTIHRDTNEVIEACWEKMQQLHPEWEFKTWYDEDEYPYVGEHLSKCPSGAFKADLIRLDVLYRFGGVYLDSDVYLVKPIDELLEHEAFCSGEYDVAFGNIAFGAVAEHPAIKAALEVAIAKVDDVAPTITFYSEGVKNPQAWGPFVHTQAFLSRDDIVRLPTKSFQPYLLNQEVDKSVVPLWRPRADVAIKESGPLTEETYGVHLNNWSWNEDQSWGVRG